MRLWEHSLSARSAQGDVDPHSWLHRRLSSIFSGESNILSASGRSFRLQKSNGISLHESSTSNRVPQAGLRSPTSTRSIIDPSASPFTSAGSISPDAFRPLQMHTNPPSVAYDRPRTTSSGARAERHLSRALAGSHRHSTRRGLRPQRRKWVWMPHIRNAKHRSNAIGALVSGVILMVMLSIYLALAIPKIISGRIWHVILIMFILVTAILFCHNLIRLCMLVLGSRKQSFTRGIPRALGEESFVLPQKPIRVILARDQELGLHEHDEEEQPRSGITHPPPAYGLWRCSVRADPNLIHWQRTSQPIVQDGGRGLPVVDDPGNRPPSYA